MVFQSYALFPHMNVAENVAYGLTVAGKKRAEALTQAEEMLETLGLKGLGSRLPSELSGGQQQRVAVARALVLRPRVLLFDEPLSNLDARLRRRVRGDIRDLQLKLNLTVVYVTHDQQEALAVSDTVVVMREGRIAQMGAPRTLYEAPQDGFIADFMGEANVVEAEVLASDGERATLRFGEATITAPLSRPATGRRSFAVRPEAITLSPPGGAGLAGTVRRAVFVGNHMEYEVNTAAGELFLIGPAAGLVFAADDAVSVSFARAIPLD
jgi:iron(III) transport system ATP-binding protein